MTRGGSRSGSGRKPLLDEEEEISVGSICERMWQDMAWQLANEEYEAQLYIKDVRHSQQELQNIPVRVRAEVETTRKFAEATVMIEDSIRYANIPADELSDSSIANNKLASERGGPDPVTVTRPYDAKDKVLAAGIAWARDKFDKNISARTADRCWGKFRELEQSVRDTWKPPV